MQQTMAEQTKQICEQMGSVVDTKLAPIVKRIDVFENRIKELDDFKTTCSSASGNSVSGDSLRGLGFSPGYIQFGVCTPDERKIKGMV